MGGIRKPGSACSAQAQNRRDSSPTSTLSEHLRHQVRPNAQPACQRRCRVTPSSPQYLGSESFLSSLSSSRHQHVAILDVFKVVGGRETKTKPGLTHQQRRASTEKGSVARKEP
eukprot:3120557-Rhodomonas_salina.3